MKKLLLITSILIGLNNLGYAQCSATVAPTNNCTFGDQIDTFILNAITPGVANAGCGANGYNLFSTPVFSLTPSNTYTWSATTGNNTWNQGMSIWIDLNNDGMFSSSEQVSTSSSGLTHSGSIIIPSNASPGNLKMRVMCAYVTVPASSDACTSNLGSYGETEDYTIFMNCPISGVPSLTVTASNTLLCLGSTATLTASGASNYTWTGGAQPITNGASFTPTSTITYTVLGGANGCPSYTSTALQTISVTSTPLAVAALINPATVCAGATASLSAGGANSYTWMPINVNNANPVVSPQATTIYTLIGFNGNGTGCPGTATVALNALPNPTLSTVASNSNICANASATLTVSGAQTFTWQANNSNNSSIIVTPTVSSSFLVFGTNSFGCTSSAQQVVIAAPSPTITLSANIDLICLGETTTLTAISSDPFVWDNNSTANIITVNPTQSSVYTATATNANFCVSTAMVVVNVFTPSLTLSPSSAICVGNNITISASGADDYLWNNSSTFPSQNISPVTTTTYVVNASNTLTNNAVCASSGTIVITVNPNPTITINATKSIICKGETNTLTAIGADTFTWNTNQTTAAIVITPTAVNTTYTVNGKSSAGCSHLNTKIAVTSPCTGLNEPSLNTSVSIYPNPNAGEFTISSTSAVQLKLINQLGQTIKLISLSEATNYKINISDLANGIYFVVGKNNEGSVSQKIVVSE
jgi:hypothetical protein